MITQLTIMTRVLIIAKNEMSVKGLSIEDIKDKQRILQKKILSIIGDDINGEHVNSRQLVKCYTCNEETRIKIRDKCLCKKCHSELFFVTLLLGISETKFVLHYVKEHMNSIIH